MNIRIIGVAKHSETKEEYVVFEDLCTSKVRLLPYNQFVTDYTQDVHSGYKLTNKESKLLYRHFKGVWYKLVTEAESLTGENFIVYIALYAEGKMWVRPSNMYFSKVDKEKYPDCEYNYRFTSEDTLVGMFGSIKVEEMIKKEIEPSFLQEG